jgi:hypothetical protein
MNNFFIVITILLFFSSTIKGQDTLIGSGVYLIYENYSNVKCILPFEFKEIASQNIISDTDCFVKAMLLDWKCGQKISLKKAESFYTKEYKISWIKKQKITGEFLNFLCKLEIVNQYYKHNTIAPSSFYDRDYEIKKVKESHSFWFIGKINLNKNFETFLFFSQTTDTTKSSMAKDLYLLNIKDNQLLSTVKISSYSSGMGDIVIFYTSVQKNGKFHYRGKYYGGDVSYARWIDKIRYRDREFLYSVYSIDNDGFVKVLYNKE